MADSRHVRIKGPENSICTQGTVVLSPDGHGIPGIYRIEMDIEVNSTIQAIIHLHSQLVDVTADPLFSLESLKGMAAKHGYKLVPAGPEDITALTDTSKRYVG